MQGDVVSARELVEGERPGERLLQAKQGLERGALANAAALAAHQAQSALSSMHERARMEEQNAQAEPAHFADDPSERAPAASLAGKPVTQGNVCLLCRRKFGNAEQLKKHCDQSDMHKQNLEEMQKAEIAKIKQDVLAHSIAAEKKMDKAIKQQHYSSIARDNRELQKQLREAEEAARNGHSGVPKPTIADNKGSDMLRKMGWSDGQGLGSKRDGITSHIGIVQREQFAGIGCGEVTREEDIVNPGDSYKSIVYKKASSRLDADPTAWRQTYSQD